MHEARWFKELPVDGIQRIQRVAGGDVNQAYQVETASEKYFLLNQPGQTAAFYDNEVEGLRAMHQAGVRVPEVIGQGELDGTAYLLLEFLAESYQGDHHALGEMVARLHAAQSPTGKYGFNTDYRGSAIAFSNAWTDTWPALFLNQRMDPLAEALVQKGLWSQTDYNLYLKVREVMERDLMQHQSKPGLLHGDLWSGNYMFLTDGSPALFDPASFYGDREFDLAITTVFGGFSPAFYEAYCDNYPLEPDYGYRLLFYRLYLLMVHLLKFGNSYRQSVEHEQERILAGEAYTI